VKPVSGRKRSSEVLLAVPFAKYGMTVGCLSINAQGVQHCGVLASGWPSWAFGAKARGWIVEVIIVKENHEIVQDLFPDSMVILHETGLILPELLCKINIWFSDIDPPRSLALWTSDAQFVIMSRRARHVNDPLWKMEPRKIAHLQCGGATTGEWVFYLYSRGNATLPSSVPTSYRDMSSILGIQTAGSPCPRPHISPEQDILPRVIQLRPNTYHGGGLMPWYARSCFVICPCVFSPTGWVRRRCTQQESLMIFDVPGASTLPLPTVVLKSLISDTSILPLRVINTLLDLIPEATEHPAVPTYGPHLPVAPPNPFNNKDVNAQVHSSLDKVQDRESRNAKATKNDDAPVPEYLWDDAIVPCGTPSKLKALPIIRTFALRWWWRHTTKDFLRWLKRNEMVSGKNNEFFRNKHVGRDCIRRCCQSSWWEWTVGSRPLFWRWPREYQKTIRDGITPWIKDALPRYMVPQRPEKDDALRELITSKLRKVREKGYIISGEVRSLTSFFSVPKGDGDVRMVYDASKSGLNSKLWAPWFLLPTIESHLRSVQPGSFMGDIDFSEQFLNFVLHEKLQPYTGVDLTPFFPEETSSRKRMIFEHWARCGMGIVSSPYTAVQGTLMAEEVIRGDPNDVKNIFRWDDVILNLPGGTDYKPHDPWVYKTRFNKVDGSASLANDLKIYVDDVRTIGGSYNECRQASRTVASIASYLGLQDAPRKRRDPTMTPGPWAGSIVHTTSEAVTISISQERWDKAKSMISWIKDCCDNSTEIDHKMLESYRGYLIYISRTYPSVNPYLKGIHLTLDSWRPWRDEDAWKMSMSEIRIALHERGYEADSLAVASKPPQSVRIAPRLYFDIQALERLFHPVSPPHRTVRPSKTTVASYMFGDASGAGFGSSLEVSGSLHYIHGQWNHTSANETSNYRELSNLINAISEASSRGFLDHAELFVFTDNSVAESAFFKGTSKSKRLFELMLQLRELQMHKSLMLHMIHVSGKRMISQGTDGLSRGDTSRGVMTGVSMLSYVPLHLDAIQRQGETLKEWILSWFTGTDSPEFLSPVDWFYRGHHLSTCIWTPPPAAADAALEQLAFSIHKRPYSTHLVLIPRLMTSHWRKLLNKICCLVFTIPLDTDVWPVSHFEPLIAGIYLPLSKHYPWNLRRTPMLERVERLLRGLPPTHPRWGGLILRELLFQARSLESMSSSMVRELLQTPGL
jgi:hypothetical protein